MPRYNPKFGKQKKRLLTIEERNAICKLYLRTPRIGIAKIAKRYGVTTSCVCKLISRSGLPMRTSAEHRERIADAITGRRFWQTRLSNIPR